MHHYFYRCYLIRNDPLIAVSHSLQTLGIRKHSIVAEQHLAPETKLRSKLHVGIGGEREPNGLTPASRRRPATTFLYQIRRPLERILHPREPVG